MEKNSQKNSLLIGEKMPDPLRCGETRELIDPTDEVGRPTTRTLHLVRNRGMAWKYLRLVSDSCMSFRGDICSDFVSLPSRRCRETQDNVITGMFLEAMGRMDCYG